MACISKQKSKLRMVTDLKASISWESKYKHIPSITNTHQGIITAVKDKHTFHYNSDRGLIQWDNRRLIAMEGQRRTLRSHFTLSQGAFMWKEELTSKLIQYNRKVILICSHWKQQVWDAQFHQNALKIWMQDIRVHKLSGSTASHPICDWFYYN